MLGSIFRRNRLNVLTWNVWFGLTKPHARWTELIRIVGSVRPDVVAFQEVTTPFLDMLRKAPWMKKEYTLSDARGDSFGSYGTVIATKHPVVSVESHPLPSAMERTLIVMEADVRGVRWAFGATHLESLRDSVDYRGRQLDEISARLDGFTDVVLMGDFNFCATWTDEQSRVPPEYVDCWSTVRSEDGFTVDSERNDLRRREKPEDLKRVRFDRVLVRSARAAPVRAKLLGTKPIRGESPPLFPSDHFGVLAEIRVG